MKVFQPRHLRKKYTSRNGAGSADKQKAFRRCKKLSDRFIHLSASALEAPANASGYARYCDQTRAGIGFRKGG